MGKVTLVKYSVPAHALSLPSSSEAQYFLPEKPIGQNKCQSPNTFLKSVGLWCRHQRQNKSKWEGEW